MDYAGASAYGTLNPGVITSRQHLKWVHRLGKKERKKKKTSDAASHVCSSPGRQHEMARRQPRTLRPRDYRRSAPKDNDAKAPLQICICLTLGPPRLARIYLLFSRPAILANHSTSLYVSLDSRYGEN